jgi:hypothetical protein
MIAKFSPDDRLGILRNGDRYRTWHTLEDQRLCVRCTKLFSGHDIRIVPRGAGQFDIHCPSDGCDSDPEHWFFHGSGLGRSHYPASRDAEADLNGL